MLLHCCRSEEESDHLNLFGILGVLVLKKWNYPNNIPQCPTTCLRLDLWSSPHLILLNKCKLRLQIQFRQSYRTECTKGMFAWHYYDCLFNLIIYFIYLHYSKYVMTFFIVFVKNVSFRLMKCIDRAALNSSPSSPSLVQYWIWSWTRL